MHPSTVKAMNELIRYDPGAEEATRVANAFRYHKPHCPTQEARYGQVRAVLKSAADDLLVMCPKSRELSLALTKLEEAMFWANAAIARNERPATESPAQEKKQPPREAEDDYDYAGAAAG